MPAPNPLCRLASRRIGHVPKAWPILFVDVRRPRDPKKSPSLTLDCRLERMPANSDHSQAGIALTIGHVPSGPGRSSLLNGRTPR